MFFLCDVIPYFSKRKFIDPHRDHKIFDAKPPFGGDRVILPNPKHRDSRGHLSKVKQ